MASDEKTHIPVTVQMRPATVEFIQRAADAVNKNRTVFLRDADVAAAEKVLGEKAPDVPTFELGAQSPIARAAKEAGISVREFMRMKTLEALGVEVEETKPRRKNARKAGKRAAKTKRVARKKKTD
jgi:uncharacterized protein (DUF1778 family)